MSQMRLSAPSNYYWDLKFISQRIKQDPIDYIIFLLFFSHLIGFLVYLSYLRLRCAKKQFFVIIK